MTVAMHCERTDDPDVLVWVFADIPHLARLPGTQGVGDLDRPTSHPVAARLLAAVAEITAVDFHPDHVAVRKRPEVAWSSAAAKVHDALHKEMEQLCRATGSVPTAAEVGALMEAAVGDTVAAHGGRIEVVGLSGDHVTVRLHGACDRCPGARATLARALSAKLRSRFPAIHRIDVTS